MAYFLEISEIPPIRKIAALLRLYGLNAAIVLLQKDAFAVRLVHQCEPAPVDSQAGKPLNEINLAQAKKTGDPRDVRIGKTHLARPPAAGSASLTLVVDGHDRKDTEGENPKFQNPNPKRAPAGFTNEIDNVY